MGTMNFQFHTIFDTDAEQEQELDVDQDDGDFDQPILEEDEEDADLLDPGAVGDDTTEVEQMLQHEPVSSDPPVLDLKISSPHSLSFTIPSG